MASHRSSFPFCWLLKFHQDATKPRCLLVSPTESCHLNKMIFLSLTEISFHGAGVGAGWGRWGTARGSFQIRILQQSMTFLVVLSSKNVVFLGFYCHDFSSSLFWLHWVPKLPGSWSRSRSTANNDTDAPFLP